MPAVETVWQLLSKLNIELTAVLLLGIYLRAMKTFVYTESFHMDFPSSVVRLNGQYV